MGRKTIDTVVAGDFTNRIYTDQNLSVFCITPVRDTELYATNAAYTQERKRAADIAYQLYTSTDDWPGGTVGFYSYRERNEYPYYEEPSYAFVLVFDGQIAGFVITRKRFVWSHKCEVLYDAETKKPCKQFTPIDKRRGKEKRHCIERVYVCKPHRHREIAFRSIKGIANYFNEDVENLGWVVPFTEAGFSLAWRLTKAAKMYIGY